MLKNILTKPVELTINGKVITFKSLDDFEFALNARTMVPLERMTDAMKASPAELDMELNTMVVAIEQLTEVDDQASETGELTQPLKSINPVIFSNDNGWRDIFFALKKDHSSESSKYKQIALSAYLKYLSNRQEMLQAIKAKLENGNAEPATFRTGELDLDENFDSKELAKKLGMTSLQKDVPVTLEVKEGDEILILLAQYQCKLVVKKRGINFIDNNNQAHPLTKYENKVGRGSDCKVRFMDTMQRISRLHMTINKHSNKKLELIDHSTYGTHYLQQSP